MTPSSGDRVRTFIVLAAFAGAAACSQDAIRSATPPPPRPSLALARQRTDSTGRERHALTLSDGGAGLVVGSFRVAVRYDTSRTVFTGAIVNDTLTVAVHDAGGRVVIAGASARGFGAGEWISLVFAPRHVGTASPSFGLEVLEFGDLHGADIRSRIVTTPPPTATR